MARNTKLSTMLEPLIRHNHNQTEADRESYASLSAFHVLIQIKEHIVFIRCAITRRIKTDCIPNGFSAVKPVTILRISNLVHLVRIRAGCASTVLRIHLICTIRGRNAVIVIECLRQIHSILPHGIQELICRSIRATIRRPMRHSRTSTFTSTVRYSTILAGCRNSINQCIGAQTRFLTGSPINRSLFDR